MNNEEEYITSAKTNKNSPLKKIKYRDLSERKFENTFDPSKYDRMIPSVEKEIDRKTKKKAKKFVGKSSRPPKEKMEYICNFCGGIEERYESDIYNQLARMGSYQCKYCASGKPKPRRSKK